MECDLDMPLIGDRIRSYRKEKGLTLAEVAEKTNLSIGYLSNLERGTSSPTLENIQKICEILNISLMKLLEEDKLNKHIIRKDERQVIFEQSKNKNKVRYESIRFGSNLLDGLIIITHPHSVFDKKWRHNYDEIGLVIEGELTILIDEEEYVLQKGDSFYIPAQTEHGLKNLSDNICESYWVKQTNDKKIEI